MELGQLLQLRVFYIKFVRYFCLFAFYELINFSNMKPEIIPIVLQEFTNRVSIKATWEKSATTLKGMKLDGYIRFQVGKHTIEMPAEVKTKVAAAHIPMLQTLKLKWGKLVVITTSIAPSVQMQLKELGIFFMDSAGNAFIQQEGLFVHIEGRRAETNVVADVRAFSKGGIKVIFQLFLEAGLINATMREIANRAAVSLDTVHKTINALRSMEYILALNKNEWIWNNKQELLTQWMIEYDRRLKPGLFINRFDFMRDADYDRWKQIRLTKSHTCWGAEPAAELLTDNLKPGEWTLYTTETEMELIKHYRIVPKKAGAIVVFKRFWPTLEQEPKFAPPLLVYTDLVNTGKRRNIETAQRIFNEYLQDKFQTT